MRAQQTWYLGDSNGANLAELTTAAGKTLSLLRNRYLETQFTVSHEDDAAQLLLDALANTGVPTLKVYRRRADESTGALRFRGYLAGLQETSDETSLLTATFRSPFGVLLGDGDRTGRFLLPGDQLTWTQKDAGVIALDMIDLANVDSPTRLSTSLERTNLAWVPPPPVPGEPAPIPPFHYTKVRDRTYPVGTNIGQAIVNLTNVLDGFDFIETFVDGIGTTFAQFNIFQSLGGVNTSARFEYGPGTLANAQGVTRNTLPPANCVFVTGANGLTSTYVDTASVAKYGKWRMRADFSDVYEQDTLDDKARALCRPKPIKTVTFVPELGLDNCPQPFDDFGIGDTVPLLARRGALYENGMLRVNGFTIPVDENGFETVEVDDPTSPEEDSVLRASLTTEVV